MTSHFRFHDGVSESLPSASLYHYPTQSTRITKNIIKLPARNGPIFRSDQASAPIHIPFPAQGYLNPRNSYLTFDIAIGTTNATPVNIHFQNNIQSVFRRCRLIYGSLPIEDIRESNVLVRMLTEATCSTNTGLTPDQASITEGIAGYEIGHPYVDDNNLVPMQRYNARLHKIQNANFSAPAIINAVTYTVANRAISSQPNIPAFRTYQVQLPLGLLQQPKLLPLKFMASQLAIELDLAPFTDCVALTGSAEPLGSYFELQNVSFNAEILEFDSVYDAAFLEGLASNDGIPIHFTSWNTYIATPSAGNTQNLPIPERNRSLKSIFNVLLPPSRLASENAEAPWDSHAMLCGGSYKQNNIGVDNTTYAALFGGFQKSYQFRIGGKYTPADPVSNGQTEWNGGSEAYTEFQKALNITGDYSLSTPLKADRWGPSIAGNLVIDYESTYRGRNNNYFCHEPTLYVTAAALESVGSSGGLVAGLNGEEQNDISLNMDYSHPLRRDCTYLTFIHYDALLVLRSDNVVELIK